MGGVETVAELGRVVLAAIERALLFIVSLRLFRVPELEVVLGATMRVLSR